jgi:hypothetical protein
MGAMSRSPTQRSIARPSWGWTSGRSRAGPLDRIGVAAVINGLSAAHRDYLAVGGMGFLIGDGALRYGHERIVETYYTAFIGRGVYLSVDLQSVTDPGYNRDRGPVLIPSARLHIDF